MPSGKSINIDPATNINNPVLWSLENPHLYKAISEVYIGNKLFDSRETSFGIRSITIDITTGFKLNGVPLKLKGGCVHHDNGPLVGVGNANPISTESYQLPQRKAWQGRGLVVVKSDAMPGKITLKASGDGLKPASFEIITQ